MAKNPIIDAQKKLYDSMDKNATARGIKDARAKAKEAWESATPAQRDEAKKKSGWFR